MSRWSKLRHPPAIANAPVPPRVGGEDWSAFVATIGDLRAGRAGWPAELERAWAGTFHGIGARLLREHSDQIGLAP
jgi:hypothetical protein